MEPNSLPSTLLTALSDQFTLLALLLVVLGFVLYQSTKGKEVAYKGIPLSFIAGIVLIVSLTALGLNVGRLLRYQAPTAAQEPPKKTSTLQVTFYGMKSRTESVTVPFRVSSGQINVDCNESRKVQASYTAPPNAKNINAFSSWENIRDVKQQDKSLSIQGTVVTAIGQLVGNNREWTGNCPGGGHGELVITGTYGVDQSSAPERVVLSTFQGFVQPNSSNQGPLPQIHALPANITGEVLVASAGGLSAKVSLDITVDASGNATDVVKPQTGTAASAPPLLSARVEVKSLTIDVR